MLEKSRLRIFACLLTLFGCFTVAEARAVHIAVPTLSMVVITFTTAREKGYYREIQLVCVGRNYLDRTPAIGQYSRIIRGGIS
jgi:hypothetical protein